MKRAFGNKLDAAQSGSQYQSFEEKAGLPFHVHAQSAGQWIMAPRMMYIVMTVFVFGLLMTLLNVYELRRLQQNHYNHDLSRTIVGSKPVFDPLRKDRPIFWMLAPDVDSGYLDHVINVFHRTGFIRRSRNTRWDVLWSHEYPFSMGNEVKKQLDNLKPHQKVNHFPGTGYITNKNSLATSPIKGIPRAFKIPQQKDEFLLYAKEFPTKMWVQKSNTHRGIKIKSVNEIEFDKHDTFIQEFVDKPFLIDGRKFDIGIYTVLTSIDPMRVYTMDGDVLLRFCPKNYHPFDATDVDKYVVGDDYTPTWEMPSLKNLYSNLNFTFKESLNAYLKLQGKNHRKLWINIKSTIRSVYMEKEQNLVKSASKYNSSRNFFEMVRFDFVLDENLNVYLMEANMSPNLSSGHFKPNSLLYEQVVLNLLSLVGLARPGVSDFLNSLPTDTEMLVSDKDVHVFAEQCASETCDKCIYEPCQLCNKCLHADMLYSLKTAYLEHLGRRNMRRVFPPIFTQRWADKWGPDRDTFFSMLSPSNKLLYQWFVGKCQQSVIWCS